MSPWKPGSKYSLDCYEDLEEVIQDVRETVNRDLQMLGVLITKHDGRMNVCKAMRTAIEQRFPNLVFQTAISSAVKIQEAGSTKHTIFQLDPQSTAARDFMEVGREALARLQLYPMREVGSTV